MKCGIYKITNIVNGMCYIGSSNQIERRWSQHKGKLKRGTHDNIHLQNAWDKFSEKNFKFEILEETSQDQLLIREQYYLDKILQAKSFEKDGGKLFYSLGYNLNPICDKPTIIEATKQKISNTLKIKINSGKIKKQGEKKVYQYNRFTGKLIKIWNSVNDANRHYHETCFKHTKIHRVLWGDFIQAHNSFWSYEPIELSWVGKPHGKSTCVIVQDIIKHTYGFFDNLTEASKIYNFKAGTHYLKKYLNNDKLFRNRFKFIKIAPIVYDGKPFELLGTREDLITKTDEEILNGTV